MLTSDTSRLHHVGSGDTIPLGGRLVLFGPQTYTGPAGTGTVSITTGGSWQVAMGNGSMATTSSLTVLTFGFSFTSKPLLFVQRYRIDGIEMPVVHQLLSTTTAAIGNQSLVDGTLVTPTSEYSFQWAAFGFVSS